MFCNVKASDAVIDTLKNLGKLSLATMLLAGTVTLTSGDEVREAPPEVTHQNQFL